MQGLSAPCARRRGRWFQLPLKAGTRAPAAWPGGLGLGSLRGGLSQEATSEWRLEGRKGRVLVSVASGPSAALLPLCAPPLR